MRLYLNGTEIEAVPESGFELVQGTDRIMVRTPSGSFSALAIRDGDAILVSYQGHQYRLETRRPRAGGQGAAASGEYRAPMPGQIVDVLVAVGDKVIFSKYGGTELKYNNEEYLVLSARDVLAVVVR
jgi:acetyl/propionyl-CoA carboxylase alpha subunit